MDPLGKASYAGFGSQRQSRNYVHLNRGFVWGRGRGQPPKMSIQTISVMGTSEVKVVIFLEGEVSHLGLGSLGLF